MAAAVIAVIVDVVPDVFSFAVPVVVVITISAIVVIIIIIIIVLYASAAILVFPRQLGLNDDASMASMSPMGSVSSCSGLSVLSSREKRRKEELKLKLSGLPAPQYEYELVAPNVSGWSVRWWIGFVNQSVDLVSLVGSLVSWLVVFSGWFLVV